MMNESQYHLQPYKGPATRHKCPLCGDAHSLALYVDESGNPIDEKVGRCNHESGCGYHYPPRQYFADHPQEPTERSRSWSRSARPYFSTGMRTPRAPERSDDFIPWVYVERSASLQSDFARFLGRLFDEETIRRVADQYHLGATKERGVIYWQIDTQGRVRAGKIMQYNPTTGHRIKEGLLPVDWVHARLKRQGILPDSWTLSQCLFGEHLLGSTESEGKVIAIVESEKSALIGAAAFPQYLWMATGGIGNLNPRVMEPLKGRSVVLFPDVDGTTKWREKAAAIHGCKITISEALEKNATQEERERKIDVADWIVESILQGHSMPQEARSPDGGPTDQAAGKQPSSAVQARPSPQWSTEGIPHLEHISSALEDDWLAAASSQNPALQGLIDGLGLEITGFQHYESQEEYLEAVKDARLVNNNERTTEYVCKREIGQSIGPTDGVHK